VRWHDAAVTDRFPTLDDLDAATVAGLLGTGDHERGPQLVTVRSEPLGTTTGFLGELRRLHLTWDPPGDDERTPGRLVAKAPTTDPGGRQVGLLLDVWAREHRFFAELAPRCSTRVPACHANLADPAAGRWLLLLGDAGDTTAAAQSDGASAEHAVAALTEIAGLHRDFAGGRPVAWLAGFDRGPLEALQAAVCGAVEPFLDRFGALLPDGTATVLRRFAPRLAEWSAAMARGPLTVVHADYRLDNLVIDAAGRVTVLDWQTTLVGPAAMDVASFLATSLTVADRRAWEDDLFASYAAVTGTTPGAVRRGVRLHLLWWMALYANNLSRLEPDDPRAVAMLHSTVRRTFTAAVDHDCAALLDEPW
jgi:hypothetical protein